MLWTKFKNQQIEQETIRLNFFRFIQFQFRYQANMLLSKQLKPYYTMARCNVSQAVQNCTSRFKSRLGQPFFFTAGSLFFHSKLDLVKDDQHQ